MGDVSAPLLRIVPVQKTGVSQGDVIAHTFNAPHYVPVKRKNFETIKMDIRTDVGEKVPFQRGKLTSAVVCVWREWSFSQSSQMRPVSRQFFSSDSV